MILGNVYGGLLRGVVQQLFQPILGPEEHQNLLHHQPKIFNHTIN
jgi:hypothetical protein